MSTVVIYKDTDGKRRQKVVPVSIFADVNHVVREFVSFMQLPVHTYVYLVRQGACTYVWKGPARDAFTQEQLRKYKY